ncbi:Os10g0159300, partial [Oryza sativa Japonica Group]
SLFRYLLLICLREGMGLATLLHDMISLSHDYCNMLIGLLVFRHNGLIKH